MKLKKLVLALLAASLILPAALVAQETTIDPYANIRLWTGVTHQSEELAGDIQNELIYKLPAINVFGFDVARDNITGKVEIGMKNNNELYLRHAFITYTVNDLELLIGQTGSPYTVVSGQQAGGEFLNLGYGAAFDGRNPQIKATYMGAYVAFIKPNKNVAGLDIDVDTADDPLLDTDDYIESLIPKTAVGYNFKGKMGGNPFNIGLGGAFNMIKIDANDGESKGGNSLDGETLLSYLIYVNGGITVDNMFAKFNATYGQNTGNFGIGHTGVLLSAPELSDKAVDAGGSLDNVNVIEGFVELGYKVTPMATLSGSVGMIQASGDAVASTERHLAYSVQCAFAVQDNFTVTPAFLYRDFDGDANDIYGGLSFVATFK